MSTLKAVFFDIDDTLYSTSLFASRARHNSIRAMMALGLDFPEKALVRELEEVIREFSSNYDRHFDKLLLRIPKRAYDGVNPATLVAGAVIAYHETKSRELLPFPDVAAALKALARTGGAEAPWCPNGTTLIRGVITDGLSVKQSEKLIRLKLYHLFTPGAIFISDDIGISKPNIKLYQRVCTELNLAPDEVMYVGDDPVNDIDPAKALGMITVLMKRGGKYQIRHGKLRPDYQSDNFRQLLKIVNKLIK
ncbi:MAG: HAD-IA family hydrolase [Planctomycetes bacterium]|nr:HAD-IA family hydrolase [Planctomycetota bacterium]